MRWPPRFNEGNSLAGPVYRWLRIQFHVRHKNSVRGLRTSHLSGWSVPTANGVSDRPDQDVRQICRKIAWFYAARVRFYAQAVGIVRSGAQTSCERVRIPVGRWPVGQQAAAGPKFFGSSRPARIRIQGSTLQMIFRPTLETFRRPGVRLAVVGGSKRRFGKFDTLSGPRPQPTGAWPVLVWARICVRGAGHPPNGRIFGRQPV